MDDKLLHETLLAIAESTQQTYLMTLESHTQNPLLKGHVCTEGLNNPIDTQLEEVISKLKISLHEQP